LSREGERDVEVGGFDDPEFGEVFFGFYEGFVGEYGFGVLVVDDCGGVG